MHACKEHTLSDIIFFCYFQIGSLNRANSRVYFFQVQTRAEGLRKDFKWKNQEVLKPTLGFFKYFLRSIFKVGNCFLLYNRKAQKGSPIFRASMNTC